MKVEYCYVAKCLNMKCPRVWGVTRKDCEEAMKEWSAKQVRLKPLGLYIKTTDKTSFNMLLTICLVLFLVLWLVD